MKKLCVNCNQVELKNGQKETCSIKCRNQRNVKIQKERAAAKRNGGVTVKEAAEGLTEAGKTLHKLGEVKMLSPSKHVEREFEESLKALKPGETAEVTMVNAAVDTSHPEYVYAPRLVPIVNHPIVTSLHSGPMKKTVYELSKVLSAKVEVEHTFEEKRAWLFFKVEVPVTNYIKTFLVENKSKESRTVLAESCYVVDDPTHAKDIIEEI